MQPYTFPYLGYFQLLNAVDLFIFYDDVDFITRGWINRNRILLHGQPHLITIPVRDASQHRPIHETRVALESHQRATLLRTLHHAYARAPHFNAVLPLVAGVLESEHRSIADLAVQSVLEMARYLGLTCHCYRSSERYDNRRLKGSERILDIVAKEGADVYVNPIGGEALYSRRDFANRGVALRFLRPQCPPYRQGDSDFVPALSIIDVLMFNDPLHVREMLTTYELE